MFWKKIHNGGIIVPIKAPANGNTGWVITFERQIKIASNLIAIKNLDNDKKFCDENPKKTAVVLFILLILRPYICRFWAIIVIAAYMIHQSHTRWLHNCMITYIRTESDTKIVSYCVYFSIGEFSRSSNSFCIFFQTTKPRKDTFLILTDTFKLLNRFTWTIHIFASRICVAVTISIKRSVT